MDVFPGLSRGVCGLEGGGFVLMGVLLVWFSMAMKASREPFVVE